MSTPTVFDDILKAVATVTSASGFSALLVDPQGALAKILPSSLTGLSMLTATSGNGLCTAPGIHLVIAYSKSDVNKHLVGLYIKLDNSGNSKLATWLTLKESTLTVSTFNAYGTIVVSGASDIVFHRIRFAVDLS